MLLFPTPGEWGPKLKNRRVKLKYANLKVFLRDFKRAVRF